MPSPLALIPWLRAWGRVGAAVLLVIAAVAIARPAAAADDPDPLIVVVNGVEIRASDLAIAEEELGASLQQVPANARREYLVNYVTDMILLAQAAEARKLSTSDDFKRRIFYSRNKILMDLVLQAEAAGAITEEAMRKIYDDAVKQMGNEEEVHARHILFRVADPKDEKGSKEAEDKAKAVVARVKKGEDFAKLASELTEDPSGKDNGGDLGYFSKDQMVPEFADVAFKLAAGQISDPVRTQFGWHVIKVEDKRKRPVPPFEQVKPQIEAYLARKAHADYIAKLRASAKIERAEEPKKN